MKTIIKSILLLFVLIITGQEAKNQQIQDDRSMSPYFYITNEDIRDNVMPLKSTSANVIISGVIADVEVVQEYQNEGIKPIEAIYVFPGSTRAAVYGMTMMIGDRTIEAEIKEKQKARQDYEQAISEGKTASLLEQQRPNVFQMSVGNIMPGDIIKVVLKYTELLVPDEGIYEFVYPTVVGPRYAGKDKEMIPQGEQWVHNPYSKEGIEPMYTFDINVKLNAGIPIAQTKSLSHKVDIIYNGKSEATINLDDEGKAGNKDFILQYALKGNEIESGILLYEGKDENFFLAMMEAPKQIKASEIPPREYIFIMDVSGSMNGFPLEISKKLIIDLLNRLKSTDKFNIMFFAGGSEMLSSKSLPATESNLKKAINFVENQQGSGGTELLPALRKALALEKSDDFSRTFIIATDGYVTVEKETFDLIRNNLGNANFFPFGIGTSVNRYIIEGMAHVGKGNPFIATSQSEAMVMGDKFRRMINNPVLTNIKLDFKGFDVFDVEPLNVPDIFTERPVVVFGKYHGKAQGSMNLTGLTGNGDYEVELNLSGLDADKNNPGLAYLWAREKIKLLDDYAAVDYGVSNEEEVTKLGLKYNLLTAYTSFVAIDSELRNADGELITIHQTLPLPDGVSDLAVSGGSMGMKKTKSTGGWNSALRSVSNMMSYDKMSEAEVVEDNIELLIVTEKMPEYIGGEIALHKFLAENIKYPAEAQEKSIEGTVYLTFIITSEGKVKDVKVLQGVHSSLDNEAIRLIKLTTKKWIPGEQGGIKVDVAYTLPISFKL